MRCGSFDAQTVRRVSGGGDIARRTASGFKRRHAHLGALALNHLPRRVIESHAVFTHDQRVRLPEALGMEARAAVINGSHRVANGEAHLVANRGNAIHIGHAGIAAAAVQFIRVLDDAVHVLHGKSNARHLVVLENGQVEHHVALAGENLGQLYVDCRAKRHRLVLESGDIGAVDTDAVGISRDGKPACLKIASVAVPDQNVAGLDAGLLQPFADGHHQHRMG